MTRGSFNYCVSISSLNTDVRVSGTNTNHTFASLLSGTPYNLTVRTVGALGFESKEVQIFMVNTSKSFVPVSEKERFGFGFLPHACLLSHNQDLSV